VQVNSSRIENMIRMTSDIDVQDLAR